MDGSIAARGGLEILSDDGFDVEQYLGKEMRPHGAQFQFLEPRMVFIQEQGTELFARRLVFHFGGRPGVPWDWWIDPNLPACLVRQEFRHMKLCAPHLHKECGWGWREHWPFRYSKGDDHHLPLHMKSTECVGWQRSQKLAQSRYDHCAKEKAIQFARIQGIYHQPRVTGAWIN